MHDDRFVDYFKKKDGDVNASRQRKIDSKKSVGKAIIDFAKLIHIRVHCCQASKIIEWMHWFVVKIDYSRHNINHTGKKICGYFKSIYVPLNAKLNCNILIEKFRWNDQICLKGIFIKICWKPGDIASTILVSVYVHNIASMFLTKYNIEIHGYFFSGAWLFFFLNHFLSETCALFSICKEIKGIIFDGKTLFQKIWIFPLGVIDTAEKFSCLYTHFSFYYTRRNVTYKKGRKNGTLKLAADDEKLLRLLNWFIDLVQSSLSDFVFHLWCFFWKFPRKMWE